MNPSLEKINWHPSGAQLQKFVAGELSSGLAVAVSAHVEQCRLCQNASAALEAKVVADWSETPVSGNADKFADMLDSIVGQPQVQAAESAPAIPQTIEVEDRTISLPRVLAKLAAGGLSWKRISGGISQAAVTLDDQTKCEFIYMAPGSKAPQHTHRGNEVTLVLNGSFSDAMGEYHPADFVARDPQHEHQPATENGCLCFSVLDSPLVFTSGAWRLLNPFNRIMFNKSQWFR